MGRPSRWIAVAAFSLLTALWAETGRCTAADLHGQGDTVVRGVVADMEAPGGALVLLQEDGTRTRILVDGATVILARDEQGAGLALERGMGVSIWCSVVLGKEPQRGEGVCPVLFRAQRIRLEGPVALTHR